MNIAMIGTGYVGLTTGALFADRGNTVVCVDKNPEVLGKLNSGDVHFYEPGLSEIVRRNFERGRLSFTDNTVEAVGDSNVSFIAVGTPSRGDGSFNLDYYLAAASDVGRALRDSRDGFKVVVGKSTVPQRTWEKVTEVINKEIGDVNVDWAYVSNPETLAEGTAVRDFSRPDRVIVGTESVKAFGMMQQLYYPFVRTKGVESILKMSPASAEIAKLGANTSLALRIAGINELARIADVTPGADMEDVRRAISSDSRIGYMFMYPSPGYGGSCFPKDIQGLVEQSRDDGYDPRLLGKIHASNEAHKEYMGERVMNLLRDGEPKTIGVWGATFKPGTDDMRDSASIPIITRMVNEGATVRVYDPKDEKARKVFADVGDKVQFFSSAYEAARDADALALLTEWPEFDSPNYELLSTEMNGNHLFDLRNRWQPGHANENGFHYFGVGRSYPLK